MMWIDGEYFESPVAVVKRERSCDTLMSTSECEIFDLDNAIDVERAIKKMREAVHLESGS